MLTDISIRIYSAITNMLRREEGQDLVEYAVLVGAIGIGAAIVLFTFWNSTALDDFLATIEGCVRFDEAACTLPGV